MFTSLLPKDTDYMVFFSEYAKRYYMKSFEKDYKGKRWDITLDSIFQNLKRIYSIQSYQVVDELKSFDDKKLFKYDFAIAQSNISAKASGNRCVACLDSSLCRVDVLMVYGKNDIPKNQPETEFIRQTLKENFPKIWEVLHF